MTRIGLVAALTLLLFSAAFAQHPAKPRTVKPKPAQPAPSPKAPKSGALYRTPYTQLGNPPKAYAAPTPLAYGRPPLVSEFAKAKNDAERKVVEEKIRQALNQQFDEQVTAEMDQLANLQARIDRVRKRLENRVAGKSALVDLQLQQVLDQADRLDTRLAVPGSGTSASRARDAYSFLPKYDIWNAGANHQSPWRPGPMAPKPTPSAPSANASTALGSTLRPRNQAFNSLYSGTKPRSLVSSATEVQPGDELLIENRTEKDMNRRVKVLADHTIQVPLLGFISTKGMNTTEIQKVLNEKAKEHFSHPAFEVFLSGVSEPITVGAKQGASR